MELEDIERRRSALGTILAQMDVPEMRRELYNTGNLRWLNRNLAVRNKDHPMFVTAQTILTEILKETKWLL